MPIPSSNAKNINGANPATATQATADAGGLEDDGGGDGEPANPPEIAPKVVLSNSSSQQPPATQSTPLRKPTDQNALLIPSASTSSGAAGQLKSPKSPRPQISVEITPATPRSAITASSTFGSNPATGEGAAAPKPKPASMFAAVEGPKPHNPPQKSKYFNGTTSPNEAVQNWVQSQATSPVAANAPAQSKRNSLPSAPSPTSTPVRNRRTSEASQKSAKERESIPRPPSATGSTSGGESHGKFSLKELLSSGPKLARRSSVSSKKSASSAGKPSGSAKGGKSHSAKGSSAGESALESKYGIYGKMAVGKGATSVVRLAHKWDRTEEKLYAVKEFRPRRNKESERDYVKKLTSEFCIASALRHPNIVETVDLMQDQDAKWCVVMEFCPGGDLYNAIRKGGMSPAEAECCFKQILMGVGYLHSQGVAHRDLKPENIFFDAKGQVKIGDFGASTVFRLPWEQTIHKSGGLCGSEPYIAPEQFAQPGSYDARLVDIWACGIVYYCLHFQELPWSCAQPSDKTYAQYAQQCASPGLSIAGIPFLKSIAGMSGITTPISGPGTPNRQDSTNITPTMASLGMTPATPSVMTPSGLSSAYPFGTPGASGMTSPTAPTDAIGSARPVAQ